MRSWAMPPAHFISAESPGAWKAQFTSHGARLASRAHQVMSPIA